MSKTKEKEVYELIKDTINISYEEWTNLDELEKTEWLYSYDTLHKLIKDYEGLIPQQHPNMYLNTKKNEINYAYALKFIRESYHIYEKLKPYIDPEKINFELFCLLTKYQQQKLLEKKEKEAKKLK